MSGKKAVQAVLSIAGVAVGIALSNKISGAAALPTNRSSPALFETTLDVPGAIIYLSNVTPTIFGAPTADFDFHVSPNPGMAIEAVHSFASAVSSGDDHEILTAFLNTTMAGSLTSQKAADLDWKCSELGGAMADNIAICSFESSVAKRSDDVVERSAALEKRRIWGWIRGNAHVPGHAAVQILYGAFGNVLYANFPGSPRSWCNNADGHNACVSWSNVESWTHSYAREMVADALNSVDFDHNSAQANRVLGSKKRHAADVCISNRAKGCT